MVGFSSSEQPDPAMPEPMTPAIGAAAIATAMTSPSVLTKRMPPGQIDALSLEQINAVADADIIIAPDFLADQTAAQEANAQALAELVGVPTVVESTEFQVPLVVVLGPGDR